MLKSRNNYNVNLLYKCISTDSCFKALTNHEIWMQKIEYLNDKRENKVSIDDRFLKIKSSVYLLPDFIFSNDSLKYEIELFRKDKLNSIAMNDYIYCHNCLQSDFDSAKTYGIGESACCSICGSTDIELIELRK